MIVMAALGSAMLNLKKDILYQRSACKLVTRN